MINELFYKHLTLRNVVFVIAILLTILFIMKNIELSMIFFASIVIACSLNPLVDKLEKKMSRNKATIIVLGGFILILSIFLLPFVAIGFYEIKEFVVLFSKYINNIDNLITVNKVLSGMGLQNIDLGAQLGHLADNAEFIFNGAIQFIHGLGSVFIYLIISIIFTFFFMADRDKIKNKFLTLFPKKARKRVEEIAEIISSKIGGYIVAQFYAILSVGVVMTIGLILFRVDYAILLGLITAVLDIVPVVGPAIALAICVIATYPSGLVPIIGVLVSFALAQLIENQAVRPYVFGKLMDVHPILIFTFLFIGAKYFGVLGALFAPAIAATTCVLIEELYIKNIE